MDEDPRLRDLEELFLSKNAIQQIPERFLASMLSLKVLDISHNQLGKVHEETSYQCTQPLSFAIGTEIELPMNDVQHVYVYIIQYVWS